MTKEGRGAGLSQRALDQIVGVEPQAADLGGDRRPAIVEEVLALGRAELLRRALGYEHADAALDQDQPLVLEGLIGLGDGQRIGAMLGGEAAHRGQGIAVAYLPVEDGSRDAVAEAEIDWA